MRTWDEEQKIEGCGRDKGGCYRSILNEKFIELANGQMEGIEEMDGVSTWTEKWPGLAVGVHAYTELNANDNHFSCAL